jgi:hypothetical protein
VPVCAETRRGVKTTIPNMDASARKKVKRLHVRCFITSLRA